MAHYKKTEKGQGLFLTVNLSEQILPGTYEHTLNRLIDEKLDLSVFDGKYNNEHRLFADVPAYRPPCGSL